MILRKFSKNWLVRVIFGCFFGMIMLAGATGVINTELAYAVPGETVAVETGTTDEGGADAGSTNDEDETAESTTETEDTADATAATAQRSSGQTCEKSLGSLGWLICPTTGKLAEAVDALYGQIEEVLQINPVEVKDGSPIYEIWKYMRGLTNIVFIIFLLVVIWSQITGVGISNYGIKRALPKLIVAAVLMNLSYIVCSLGVDLSNVIGSSLGGIFNSIAEATSGSVSIGMDAASVAEMYSALASGTALAVAGGVIAFELGAIWMLIPVVLGAIVAVVSGLITISLRQAVVALLVMIAPLAIVAYMLPNTEQLFNRWKQLLIKMLTFYPMFSVLFWASKFAGWGIMASAQSGFGLLLGVAVQIFPLFFSWSLMKMSGTFLGAVNMRLRGLAMPVLGANRRWADSMRMHSQMKHLAAENAYTPSLKLMQVLSDMRTKRDFTTKQYMETVRLRGMAYHAQSHYKWRDGHEVDVTAFGEEQMELGARNAEYQEVLDRNKNHINKGVSGVATIAANSRKLDRIQALDTRGMDAADALVAEKARGEKIDYDNAKGRHNRFEAAMNAHMDEENMYERNADGTIDRTRLRTDYKKHFELDSPERQVAMNRYNMLYDTMEGDMSGIQYTMGVAAQSYDSQKKIYDAKMQKFYELTPPTKDVEYRLDALIGEQGSGDAIRNIDGVIAGLRVLNQRGDTDLLKDRLQSVIDQGVDLGTHASQALASFLMFEVKDNDPFLRRFGKYINLETAQVYNKNRRQNARVTLDEYVTGEYEEGGTVGHSKRAMDVLLEGTSLDNIERTAMKDLDELLMHAYKDGSGNLDVRRYLEKRGKIQDSFEPQFISASLKYLSGSEQLKSLVSFLTGYNGDGTARWEGSGDLAGDADFAREFFKKRSLQYISDQTPTQILGMRSDYRDPLMEHLANAYLNDEDDEDGTIDEKQAEFERIRSEIQGRYTDDTPEEADRKRKRDLKSAKMALAGKQLRKILGNSGKLSQIHKTRNSGAANGAKDWLRQWVLLDDEKALRREVTRYEEKRRAEGSDTASADGGDSTIYTEGDRARFENEMSELRDRIRDEDSNVFYERTRRKFVDWFGESAYIVRSYEDWHNHTASIDNDDLYDKIKELLEDIDNYPGGSHG